MKTKAKATPKLDMSANQLKDVKGLIKLVKNADKVQTTFRKTIETDIVENKGQILCLTAQHLFNTDGNFKDSRVLNSLSRAIKRVTADDKNELEPVKLSRIDRKTNEMELVPNMKAEKEFSTFVEIEKLLNRTEGKTANNLNEKETQSLIQALGKTIS